MRSALPTSYGIVAWRYGAAGVRVYRQDGSLRFTALPDKVIPGDTINPWLPPLSGPPRVAGPYLYVLADRLYTSTSGTAASSASPDPAHASRFRATSRFPDPEEEVRGRTNRSASSRRTNVSTASPSGNSGEEGVVDDSDEMTAADTT